MKLGLISRGQRQTERLRRMMQRLDVDVVALAESGLGHDLSAAGWECQHCHRTSTCEAWLDGKAPEANPYAFCPNGALFDEHRRS